MKHYLHLLLLAAICGSTVSCQQAEEELTPTLAKSETDKNIKVGDYTINVDTENKTATITELEIAKNQDVVIPSNITYNNVIYTVTGVGGGGFYTWDVFRNAASLKLPETLKSIGGYFFYKLHFNTIEIPNSVESIGTGAFYYSNLETIRIPSNVKNLYYLTFQACKNLISIDLPEGLETIEGEVFKNCSALKTISIPTTVTKIGYTTSYSYRDHQNYTFASCTSLLTAKIPNVETICKNCFDGCTQLQNVTLGEGVKTIATDAFKDCTNLKNLCVYATTPPTLTDENIFSSTNYENCTLYVPESALETYKAADGWKNFKNISTKFPDEQTAEELKASFTDDNPTLTEGTYKTGNLTYTRENPNFKAGLYVTLCLPFSINLAETECFSEVLIPQNLALYQTNNDGMLIILMDKADKDAIIPSGQPFLAKLSGDKISLKNCYSTYIRSTYQEDLKQNMETEIKVFNFDGKSGLLERNEDITVKFCGTFSPKTSMASETTRTFTPTGSFAPDTQVNAFRAYIYKSSTSSRSAVKSMTWGGMDGKSIDLPKGIYTLEGKKLIINK